MVSCANMNLYMEQPGERLIRILEDLRLRLNTSGVERTQGLRDAMGEDCRFYRKSLDLFLGRDLTDLRQLLETAAKEMNDVR